ncbi:MAG TPA: hypothetical protein VFX59_07195 [Polyangiales bacterium]|nr:hypothetical protein [Polyangiales bacterium]
MEEEQRKKVVGHLDELRDQVSQRLGDHEVGAHVEQVRALVVKPDAKEARTAASGLEKKLLAWEAEHPTLVALANRVVRALEDSGL